MTSVKGKKNGLTCVDLNHIDFHCIDKNSSSKYFEKKVQKK